MTRALELQIRKMQLRIRSQNDKGKTDEYKQKTCQYGNAGCTGNDIQLCGKLNTDQFRDTGNEARSCQSGDCDRAVFPGTSGSISGGSYADPADRFFIWKWNVDHLQSGRRNLKLSGYGIDEEAERIFHSWSQYRRRRVAQYRSDHRGIHCGRESETGLLSAGTSDRWYSDRIRDGNDK